MRNPEQLNSRIREIMEQYQAAGLAAAVIDRSGSTLYEQYFGYRNAETKEPVNEDTVFGLASVTKSFTALCIMKMAEDGLLDTDDPVSQYLPEFDDHHGKIRIRHLLSHSAGFWPLHRTTIAEVRSRYALNSEPDPADDITLAEKGAEAVIAQMNKAEDFIDAPGIYSSYCNDGFGLLSEIIRRHGDCDTYPEYLEKHILVPLGMTRSSCRFTPVDDNAAVLYRIENGQRTGDRDYTRDAFTLHGGGAMKSTLHDTKQYLGMYLNEGIGLNGREIVKERCIRSMYMPRIPFGGTSYYGYGLYSDTQDIAKGTAEIIVRLPVEVWNTARSIVTGEDRSGGVVSVVGVADMAGKITSADVSQYSTQLRIADLLSLLASLNMALFIFNLIPLLPLDGGHMLGAIIEGVRNLWAKARGKPKPAPFDTARLIGLSYVVAGAFLVMTVILILADIVNPVF